MRVGMPELTQMVREEEEDMERTREMGGGRT